MDRDTLLGVSAMTFKNLVCWMLDSTSVMLTLEGDLTVINHTFLCVLKAQECTLVTRSDHVTLTRPGHVTFTRPGHVTLTRPNHATVGHATLTRQSHNSYNTQAHEVIGSVCKNSISHCKL